MRHQFPKLAILAALVTSTGYVITTSGPDGSLPEQQQTETLPVTENHDLREQLAAVQKDAQKSGTFSEEIVRLKSLSASLKDSADSLATELADCQDALAKATNPTPYTGIVMRCRNPRAVINGKSSCPPCRLAYRQIYLYGRNFTIGQGPKYLFNMQEHDGPEPMFDIVVDGKVQKTIRGFEDGDLDKLLMAHPRAARRSDPKP